jgi:hypothetical protein
MEEEEKKDEEEEMKWREKTDGERLKCFLKMLIYSGFLCSTKARILVSWGCYIKYNISWIA